MVLSRAAFPLFALAAVGTALPPQLPGYTLQTAMDCGYPVCQSITGGQIHSTNLSHITAVCR